MTNFPWSARRVVSSTEDTAVAALLAGTELPADAAAGLRPVADVLAALRAGPASDELAGLAAAQAEFRRGVGAPEQPKRSPRRRAAGLASRLGAKAAAAAAAAAISLGGVAAAAYAGALPGSLQQFAHRTIGAPAGHRAGHDTPVGPRVPGPAAQGLCTSYRHAAAHGNARQKAVAFRNLVKAAGGRGKVAAWCAAVSRHAHSPSGPHSHRTGPPPGHASPHRTAPPHGHPSPHRTGPPPGHASPHANGPAAKHATEHPTGS